MTAAPALTPQIAELIAPLRSDPASAAVLCDVDGTLAPIVGDPEDAAVPARTQETLRELARRYALVACVSGRRAVEARSLVGVEELAYAGNHGLELLAPGAEEAILDPAIEEGGRAVRRFVLELEADALDAAGLRLEDKGPIQALHWRGAFDEKAAERRARLIADDARKAGLEPHWGRKVLEIRPASGIDKGTAVQRLLADHPIEQGCSPATTARTWTPSGRCARCRRGGCAARSASPSAPPRARRSSPAADAVSRPRGVLGVLTAGAAQTGPRAGRALMLFVDLLRVTVLLIGGSATALGAVTVVAAKQDGDYTTLIVAAGWWTVAAGLGLYLGSSPRAGEAMARALATARTATLLPTDSPGRIAFLRLWPIAAFAIVVGGLAWLLPQVAAVGAGFAILNALAWRNRERAVTAIEERDGVRFYVDPTSALEPIKLIRTPGLGARSHAGRPSSAAAAGRQRGLAGVGSPAWGRSLAWRAAAGASTRAKAARAPIAAITRGTRQHQGRSRIDRLAEPAGDRAADRGAEEDHRVERHHPAAHRRLRRELERGVDARREGDAGGAQGDERNRLERQRGAPRRSAPRPRSRTRRRPAGRARRAPAPPATRAPRTAPAPMATARTV